MAARTGAGFRGAGATNGRVRLRVHAISRIHRPQYVLILSGAFLTSLGDGFLMATKMGATCTHLGYGAVYAYGRMTDSDKRRGVVGRAYELAVSFGGVTVNKNGRRSVREETSPTGVSLRLVEKPEQRPHDSHPEERPPGSRVIAARRRRRGRPLLSIPHREHPT